MLRTQHLWATLCVHPTVPTLPTTWPLGAFSAFSARSGPPPLALLRDGSFPKASAVCCWWWWVVEHRVFSMEYFRHRGEQTYSHNHLCKELLHYKKNISPKMLQKNLLFEAGTLLPHLSIQKKQPLLSGKKISCKESSCLAHLSFSDQSAAVWAAEFIGFARMCCWFLRLDQGLVTSGASFA